MDLCQQTSTCWSVEKYKVDLIIISLNITCFRHSIFVKALLFVDANFCGSKNLHWFVAQ
jgi:hypothetical protein